MFGRSLRNATARVMLSTLPFLLLKVEPGCRGLNNYQVSYLNYDYLDCLIIIIEIEGSISYIDYIDYINVYKGVGGGGSCDIARQSSAAVSMQASIGCKAYFLVAVIYMS